MLSFLHRCTATGTHTNRRAQQRARWGSTRGSLFVLLIRRTHRTWRYLVYNREPVLVKQAYYKKGAAFIAPPVKKWLAVELVDKVSSVVGCLIFSDLFVSTKIVLPSGNLSWLLWNIRCWLSCVWINHAILSESQKISQIVEVNWLIALFINWFKKEIHLFKSKVWNCNSISI